MNAHDWTAYPLRRGTNPYSTEFAPWDTHPDNPRNHGPEWVEHMIREAGIQE